MNDLREIMRLEYYKAGYLLRSGRISKEVYNDMINDTKLWTDNLAEVQKRSRRRKTIRDNIDNKKLNWYVTFTLKSEKQDINEKVIKTNITQLLRYYNIQYVLIPEHTKKDIIHFHGFIDIRDKSIIRRKIINDIEIIDKFGNEIWELIPMEENYGFTNLVNINDKEDWQRTKMINYVTKYLEKEGNKIMSSRLPNKPLDLAKHYFPDIKVKSIIERC